YCLGTSRALTAQRLSIACANLAFLLPVYCRLLLQVLHFFCRVGQFVKSIRAGCQRPRDQP
ncbi:MAG: hypothetical protein PVJ03_11790, partial [Chromatiaceae bacterium]